MNPFLIGAVLFGGLLLLRICIWIENKFFNRSSEIVVDTHSTPIPVRTNSPYKKKNFQTFEGVTQPTNATVLGLMNHIGLEFDGEPFIHELMTHIVVPVIWVSSIEHHYDKRWSKGESPMKGDIKFDLNQFDGYNLRESAFVTELQDEAMKFLWNYYYKCYPEIFLHHIPGVKTE